MSNKTVTLAIHCKGQIRCWTMHRDAATRLLDPQFLEGVDRSELWRREDLPRVSEAYPWECPEWRTVYDRCDLAPQGSGIVLIDADRKCIIDGQGYADVGEFELSRGAALFDPRGAPANFPWSPAFLRAARLGPWRLQLISPELPRGVRCPPVPQDQGMDTFSECFDRAREQLLARARRQGKLKSTDRGDSAVFVVKFALPPGWRIIDCHPRAEPAASQAQFEKLVNCMTRAPWNLPPDVFPAWEAFAEENRYDPACVQRLAAAHRATAIAHALPPATKTGPRVRL